MSAKLPDIYFFNPTCDFAIANGSPSWMPNRVLQKMEAELATLSMFFAEQKDMVLVGAMPSEKFLNSFSAVEFQLPHFIELKSKSSTLQNELAPAGKILPWGWSPAAHRLLEPYKNSCSDEFRQSPVFQWNKQLKFYCSRQFALEVLSDFQRINPKHFIISTGQTGEMFREKEAIGLFLEKWGKLMIKAPWSSSGRGLQPITKTPVHPKVWEKIMAVVHEQGYVVAEPLLEKLADLAFQFEIRNKKITFIGYSHFFTDTKGQYQGNYLNSIPHYYPPEIKNFIATHSEFLVAQLITTLEKTGLTDYYEGFFGIDTLIFRDQNQIKINPCLEINLRYNMGLLSLKLEELTSNDNPAFFRLYYSNETPFSDFAAAMLQKYPFRLTGSKILSGFFPLTEFHKNFHFGAYLLVGKA